MQQQFTSDKNKGILWKLMVDNNIFHDIPENRAELIKNEFDKKIGLIGAQITHADQLMSLNKRVISEMVNELDRHRAKGSSALSNPTSSGIANPIDPPPYNSTEIGQQRQQKFATELKNKQTEFDKLNNKQIPTKIDFLDKNEDTPIGADMENLIAAQIAARERELNIVLGKQDKTAASNWIQNGQANAPQIQLKIGEPIKIEEKEILNPVKKVQFMGVSPPHDEISYVPSADVPSADVPSADVPSADNTDSFMTMLKKKSIPTPILQEPPSRVLEMLEEILIKQDMIIRMLINNKIEIGNEQKINNIFKE